MGSWLDNCQRFLSSMDLGTFKDAASDGGVSPELLALLRQSLEELETIFSKVAQARREMVPEEAFGTLAGEMTMLEKGLLIKVFVEIARSDRQWCPADRQVAAVLFKHIWGTPPDNVGNVIIDFDSQATTFSWDQFFNVFVSDARLVDLRERLASLTIRVANLIAKADGRVQPAEMDAIRRIEREVDRCLFADRQSSDCASARSLNSCQQQVAISAPSKAIGRVLRLDRSHVDELMEFQDNFAKGGLAEALQELDDLVGLAPVKEEVRELVDFLHFQKQREEHGLTVNRISLHACFVGNPGTGKTTVARLLGRIFKELGILAKGHTIETDRSGLVAEYAGQTAPKTYQKINEALDGVLFVDEAYSLVPEHLSDAYGAEAIQVLLKRIEDDRDRLVAILAGYPSPMDRMLRSNAGLSSRFQLRLEFLDFTVDELLQIFQRICDDQGYSLPEDTTARFKTALEYLVEHRDEHFGNGRLIRNLFEAAIRNMARRVRSVAPVTRELLTTLRPEDLQFGEVPDEIFAGI